MNEVAELHIKRILKELPPIVTEGTLEQRLDGMVANASRRNELIAPVRRAAALSEPFSQVIRERHAWLRSKVRRAVRRVFAEELDGLAEVERSSRVAAPASPAVLQLLGRAAPPREPIGGRGHPGAARSHAGRFAGARRQALAARQAKARPSLIVDAGNLFESSWLCVEKRDR